MRCLLVASLFGSSLVAQIPIDSVLVLESQSQVTSPNYRLVDSLGRGSTTLRNQSVFVQPSPTSVAVDPAAAGAFWFQTATSSLPGTWRSELGRLARLGTTQWGPWSTVACDRVEVTATRVLTLRNGAVESRPKAGGAATTLFTLPGAVDLAAQGTFVWVASGGAASALVEWNLATSQLRTIGTFAAVSSVAASPFGGELCLGTTLGDLVRVDIATGAVIGTTPTGLGPIVAVGYTRYGTLVWASAQQLWSEFVPSAPIFVSNAAIVDFGVSTTDTASIVPFGAGCGLAANATWEAPSLPFLGNAGFSLGVRSAPANAYAVLMLGASRTLSSVFGAALPADLAPIGAAGCSLLVDPLVLFALPTNGSGAADQPFPIPNTPGLTGVEWVGQWLVPDAGIGSLGLAASEGVAFVLW